MFNRLHNNIRNIMALNGHAVIFVKRDNIRDIIFFLTLALPAIQ